ncbi:MAG: cell division protein FtsQ/DivIB [Candidatus Omnitrophota bacterium]
MKNKNTKSKSSFKILPAIIILVFFAFFGFVVYKSVISFFESSSYFTIRSVMYPPSLKFIETSEIPASLKGKNILKLDINKLQKQLQVKYPQFGQLRIVKRFPDRILVIAKERIPFARVQSGTHRLAVDRDGVVLSKSWDDSGDLPVISGINLPKSRISLGAIIRTADLQVALRIIAFFRVNKTLAFYGISKMDVSNLSQISCYLSNDIKIILDEDDVYRKLRTLILVLSQAKKELPDVKYIDLRFKEPIVGKK